MKKLLILLTFTLLFLVSCNDDNVKINDSNDNNPVSSEVDTGDAVVENNNEPSNNDTNTSNNNSQEGTETQEENKSSEENNESNEEEKPKENIDNSGEYKDDKDEDWIYLG